MLIAYRVCLALEPFIDAGAAGGVIVAIFLMTEQIVLFPRQVVDESCQLARRHFFYHFVIIFHLVLHEIAFCLSCPWNRHPLTSFT